MIEASRKDQLPDLVEGPEAPIDNDRRKAISDLAAAIDFESPRTIMEFGSKAAQQTDHFTDVMLSKSRPADLDETGNRLTEIVLVAQQFDIDSLDNPWGRVPVVGSLLKSLMMTKQRAVARFESVKTQVDKLVNVVENTAQQLQERDADYQDIYRSVREEYESLGLHIEALELRLSQLAGEQAKLDLNSHDLAVSERASVLEAAQKNLSKRGDDLRVLQHAMLQMLPMVRILQANNLAVIDKFTTIRTLTLPTWKRTFLLALSLNEQKDAADLADTIDDATNKMLTRNAEMLRQNSVAIAKSNQRLVIDISTLKSVHSNILATLSEVRQIHVDGQATRASTVAELDNLRREMTNSVKAIVNSKD